ARRRAVPVREDRRPAREQHLRQARGVLAGGGHRVRLRARVGLARAAASAVPAVAPRTIALASAAVSAALFVGVAAAVAGPWWTGLAPMALAAIPVGTAAGDAVRSRRELVVALEDRARRAEEALEQE